MLPGSDNAFLQPANKPFVNCLSFTTEADCSKNMCDKDGDGKNESPCQWNKEQQTCHCAPPKPDSCDQATDVRDCPNHTCDNGNTECGWSEAQRACVCPPKESSCEGKKSIFECTMTPCDKTGARCQWDPRAKTCQCPPKENSCEDKRNMFECLLTPCESDGTK